MKYILSFDLGTGGIKTSLFDETGVSCGSSFVSIETYYPQENYREQKPEEWWQAVVKSTKEVLARRPECRESIVAIAASGHSLVTAPIDQNGRLLTEYTPIWTDARAQAQAERFFRTIDKDAWYLDTGSGFPAHLYGIFEIMWMQENLPDVYEQAADFIGTKDYINLRLTGRACTDHSYASGSGVYSLKNRQYVPAYIAAAGIDARKLPELLESHEIVGTLCAEAASELDLPQRVIVAAGGVDNACMCLGAACTEDGDSYTSLGTSAWIAVSSHEPIVNVRTHPYVFAHCIPGMYASATSIFSAGNSFRWVKNQLFPDYIEKAKRKNRDVYDLLTELAATAPAGSDKLIFNPTLAGGSGLDKSENIRGCFTGLTLGHTRADLVRATLEGVCMGLRMSMDILAEETPLNQEMLLVGGGGKSRFWRTLFASIYDKTIIETNVGEDAGSLGAAVVAGVAAGLWQYGKVKELHHRKSAIAPDPELRRVYAAIQPVFAKIADMQSDIGDMLQALEI